jgi:hypothetical protein
MIEFRLRYECKIIEHPDSGEEYMSVRSQSYRFRIDNYDSISRDIPHGGLVMDRSPLYTIPSMEEHEQIVHGRSDFFTRGDYLRILKRHLLSRVERRIQEYVNHNIPDLLTLSQQS